MHDTVDTSLWQTVVAGGIVACLASAAVVVWCKVYAAEGKGVLTVAFLDVGQGDAVYLEAPHGTKVLVDGGAGRAVLERLGEVMSFADRTIDVVLATHPDADHIGGLPEVFARYDIGMFLEPGVRDDGADSVALAEAVRAEGLKPLRVQSGMTLVLEPGVSIEILFPDRDVSGVDPNTGSIVVRLSYGDTSFLLTGDAPTEIETYLVDRYGNTLASTVLKVGHHGSRTSTSDAFLGFVNPTYGVISVGCHNTYGHPHEETIERLARFGVREKRTCEEGTIVFESDGRTVRVP